MLEDCSASPNADWGGNTVYSSREFLLLELFRALPLKVVWGRNSFREIGPNYVVRFEMSVSWLLLMCVIYLSQVMILTEKWHTGEKKSCQIGLPLVCYSGWRKKDGLTSFRHRNVQCFYCSISTIFYQCFRTNTKSHFCLLFPFPKPALQNKASDKTTYVLYLNGLSSWHLYQISIHRKCRGLGRESRQDYCPSLGKYLTVQFQLFWILRFYQRVNVSFCDVKLYILPQYRLRISFFFWDEPCGGTTKRP